MWENYELLATQWPSNTASKTDCNGAPAPTFLANTTLETYSQGVVPLASSSCMACHGNATTQHDPATPSDFTFILEKAQCENGVCAACDRKGPGKTTALRPRAREEIRGEEDSHDEFHAPQGVRRRGAARWQAPIGRRPTARPLHRRPMR